MAEVRWAIDHPQLLVGIVEARGLQVRPADAALSEAIEAEVTRCRAASWPPDELRRAIRDLLRQGGFKPTGRSKPASEYLAQAATEGAFPHINNIVDINNLLSLRTGWPMSLLDLEAMGGADCWEIRYGRTGESYVFNASGQVIDLAGLICVARVDGPPVGNPVKDSLVAKTSPATRNAVGFIYTSRRIATPERVSEVAGEFGRLLEQHAGASSVRSWVLP